MDEFGFVQNQRREDITTLRAVDALPVVVVEPVKGMSNTTPGRGYGPSQLVKHANPITTQGDVDVYSLDDSNSISCTVRIISLRIELSSTLLRRVDTCVPAKLPSSRNSESSDT